MYGGIPLNSAGSLCTPPDNRLAELHRPFGRIFHLPGEISGLAEIERVTGTLGEINLKTVLVTEMNLFERPADSDIIPTLKPLPLDANRKKLHAINDSL
ncbi:MAG: hypothetical protein NC924_04950 [Candidatus Omnitrophica bacterium]|nr:hypothetical protein [Candidatus Omnitrophota bacterium]